ncbi:unnamed protein product [Closterium sp. NIES-53]
MASLNVLTFDAEGRAVDFEVWLDDLQLFLQCDSKDGLSLFDLTSGASTASTADADSCVRSQCLTRDAAARLAVRNHLPSTERAHFSQYKSARALYDAVVARYSSPTTAALSRLMLLYLFPDLAAISTVADLVAHLRTSDARYRAALPTEDHFLSLCPAELTIDLLEERLAAAEKSILAVGASRGDRRTPFFEGLLCFASSLDWSLPSILSQFLSSTILSQRPLRDHSAPTLSRTCPGPDPVPDLPRPQPCLGPVAAPSRTLLGPDPVPALFRPRPRPELPLCPCLNAAAAKDLPPHRSHDSPSPSSASSAPSLPSVMTNTTSLPASHADNAVERVEVAADFGASRGAESGGAETGGAEFGGAEPGGAETGGAGSGGAEPGAVASGGAEPGAAGSGGVDPVGAGPGGPSGAFRASGAGGAAGAGGSAATGGSGAGGAAGAGTGGSASDGGAGSTGPRGARTGGTGAAGAGGAPGSGATGGAGAGGAVGVGADAGGTGVVPAGSGGAAWPRPYFVPLLEQLVSPLPAPSPYAGPTGGLAERRTPESRPASPVCTARTSRRVPRLRPPAVHGTHQMALRPSTASQRFPLPSPPASSLPALADPASDSLRVASPTVTRLLAAVVTDPSFESTAASGLVTELVDFAAHCRLNFAASLVAESSFVCPPSVGGECALSTDVLEDRQEEFQCFAAALPHLVSLLLAPEGDPDAPDIPTPRSYAEAIEGPSSSQWQAAMDAEMASWKSTGTYVDEVPPPGPNIVSGMWIFRVKQPPGSPSVFKARYVARGFSQRQGVDYFHTFSPTPKMTTLRVLLHVAAQRDYELQSLEFSTAFLQGSLHEEMWLRRPPGFTGSFPPGTQWSLWRPVYGLRQAPREWHDTQRTTLAALGFAPSTADPSLFLRTDTLLPSFYILVYVDDLVFATGDIAGLAHVKSELKKRHTCTDMGELRSYLGLQITRDRARHTITLTQSHMVQQVLQRFDFTYSSPQATPLSTHHSLSALPSDESVEPSGPYPELVGCLVYLMTCTRPDLAYPLSILARFVAPGRHRPEHMAAAKRVLRYLCSASGLGLVLGGRSPVVLTGHADASWVDDLATQWSSQGYTFSLGSGSVSWRSTRSSSVLSSSCEAEIYAGAMAAQELRRLTYLLTDLGEPPHSPPVCT